MKRLVTLCILSFSIAFGGLIQPAQAQSADPDLIESPTYKDILGGLEETAQKTSVSTKSLEEQVMDLIRYALGFMAVIAFALIMYGGLKLLTAGGDADAIKKSKDIVLFAFLGLIVVSFSLTMVGFVGKGIDVILKGTGGDNVQSTAITSGGAELDVTKVVGGTALQRTVDPKVSILNAIKYILSFVAIIALIFVIYGGVRWMTSGGNPDNVKAAQITLRNALLGLLVIIFSLSITMLAINAILVADPNLKTPEDPGTEDEPSFTYATAGSYCISDAYWSSKQFDDELGQVGGVDYMTEVLKGQCVEGLYCINALCASQKSDNGESCSVDTHCKSGFCRKASFGGFGPQACDNKNAGTGGSDCTCWSYSGL